MLLDEETSAHMPSHERACATLQQGHIWEMDGLEAEIGGLSGQLCHQVKTMKAYWHAREINKAIKLTGGGKRQQGYTQQQREAWSGFCQG